MSFTGSLSRPVTSTTPSLHSRSYPRWTDDLQGLRKRLQDAWSDATIHESFRSPAGVQVMPSHGQCAVTSAWLIETLAAAHVRNLTYCTGDLYSMDAPGQLDLEHHAWVEVTYADDRLVVDLTSDQSTLLRPHPVTYAWHDDLQTLHRIDYRPHHRLTPLQLQYDPIHTRLAALKQALQSER
ncbi:hypothetical protein GCM10009554_61760 [Kribbella koreensis]|uniref:Transglutaminase superfamily protein n=1 Tax=Kribbella koreensis TaxID=57909 RepID=A0ABP4BU72_9ACTN